MHGDGVHDPGHDLRVGTHVRRRDVLFRTDEDRYLGGVAAGKVLELVWRQLAGVAGDSPLGSAVRQPDCRALPRHQHGQRLHEVEVDGGVVADAALSRTSADVVLDAPAGEHMDRPVVHPDREMDRKLTFDVAQAESRVIGEPDHVSCGIKPPLGGLEGGGAGFDRHFGTSDTTPCPAGGWT